MALIELDEKEKELIKKAIGKRVTICNSNLDFYDKHLKDVNNILNRIEQYFVDLKPIQKAIISGCIKDLMEGPNSEILGLSDFDIFKIRKLNSEQIKEIDVARILQQKLHKKKTPKRALYKSILERIDLLLNSDEVCYSYLSDGKIYKAAIMVSDKRGLRVEMHGALLDRFDFEPIVKDVYMTSDKPEAVLQKLKEYANNNELTTNQERVREILESIVK